MKKMAHRRPKMEQLRLVSLTGTKAVVTGSTSGIGAGIARLLAKEGAEVAIVGRNADRGEEVVSMIRADGGSAFFQETDVSKSSEVEEMFKACKRKLGTIDVLVNNAGVQSLGKLTETTEEEWDKVFGVNAKGTFLCSRAVVPLMLENHGGSIVNIASVGGLRSFAGGSIYCSSKAAVVAFTKALALEYGSAGIRSNCICPGSIETPMLNEYAKHKDVTEKPKRKAKEEIAAGIPAGRIGAPDDVARVVVFLASPSSSFLNGGIYVVDGGATAGQIAAP
jgi:NAD(P)-dependent dehydrogenase (short-subunit alcohol dehydrogenase family)